MKPFLTFSIHAISFIKTACNKYILLIFACFAVCSLQQAKAQQAGSPEDLYASLVVIFHHTFEEATLAKPAQDTLIDIINKAIKVYRLNESDETYSLIELDFQRLCDKIFEYKLPPKDEDDPNEKPEINNTCIGKAKAARCPLWPFC